MNYVQLFRIFNKRIGSAIDYETIIDSYAEYYASIICKPISSINDLSEYLKPTSIYYTKIYYIEKEGNKKMSMEEVNKLLSGKIGKLLDIRASEEDTKLFVKSYNEWVTIYQTEVYNEGLLPYWCDNLKMLKQLYLTDFPFPFDITKIKYDESNFNGSKEEFEEFCFLFKE